MIAFLRNRVLTVVFVLGSLGAFEARADLYSCGVDLGAAGRTKQWAVFTLGDGVDPNVSMSGNSEVRGAIGAAGTGNVTLSGQAKLKGRLYYHTGGKLTLSGSAGTADGRFQDAATDSLLNQAAIDAQNASDEAFGLAVTPQYASLTNVNISSGHNITITGSGCVVLKLTDFVMTSGTFTLQGTAGTSFIINVSNQFSLSGSSKIVLGTGILTQDVLFNVRGTGTVSLSGSAKLDGVLLATNRSVSILGSATVRGEVIANSVNISGSGSVITPTTNR